ncbi:thioredoxin family protein [Siphonobacter sp. SORGH_AS_1065]|uniref:thioredoxin family protein n=1 Tax=Siphonobacter sp. SORGH_AS_1065 TaxID=3041795 RepID=UPI0027884438|nr:thioredoxin family protein [Siphonobacter sp. SORGH_AS_1065]MDQ1087014.1 glutathione peroxidase-family protein [Siphonobacter sp. SORGH_AS_1065]
MNTRIYRTCLWIGLLAWSTLKAADHPTDQRGYNIGETVANFVLKNVDGRMLGLSEFRASKGVIVVFTTNHCPYAKAYEDRIIALDAKYKSQGFPVLAINPNDPSAYEEDSYENMKVRANAKRYPFPYLFDDTQKVAKNFGASRTPQVYILVREGDKFTVQYMGALDDNSQDPSGVTRRYVEDAVNNLIQGKPVMLNVTKSVGCAIQWKE